MAKSPLEHVLGRYEYYSESENSDKFWQCIYDRKRDLYITSWGRNGNDAQGTKVVDEGEAFKKINEKIAKGYRLTERAYPKAGPTREIRLKKPKTKKASAPLKKLLDENAEISPSDFINELKKLGDE